MIEITTFLCYFLLWQLLIYTSAFMMAPTNCMLPNFITMSVYKKIKIGWMLPSVEKTINPSTILLMEANDSPFPFEVH